jgi:hypothetical protein
MNVNDQPNIQTDGLTLVRAIDSLEARGFKGQFRAKRDGLVQCLACEAKAPAFEVAVEKMVRVEGVSDPDDMGLVVAVQCKQCRTKGTLVLAFGPRATPEDAEIIQSLNRGDREFPRRQHL